MTLVSQFDFVIILRVVEAVEVGFVGRDSELTVGVGYGYYGFKDGAFAVLNPLAHRVEVGCVVDSSRENTLSVLAFAFAVELFPPFSHEVEFGIEVDEDFSFLEIGRAHV